MEATSEKYKRFIQDLLGWDLEYIENKYSEWLSRNKELVKDIEDSCNED
jgi:hypothetical protein